MYIIQLPSGVVDAATEAVLVLVTIALCAGTLDRIRGLSLEHKLRRGKVLRLDRPSLTIAEAVASLIVVIGLPIATLLTSLGRNGKSAPTYTSQTGLIDVWDTDLSGPLFPFDKAEDSVLMCGTNARNMTAQAANVDGRGYCPGNFKLTNLAPIQGFVLPKPTREKHPEPLHPAFPWVSRWGNWRSQCNVSEESGEENICYSWKWTKEAFTVCPPYEEGVDYPDWCNTYQLGPGAPEIDSDKAGPRVSRGSKSGGGGLGTELLVAHFTLTKLSSASVEVLSGEKEVTVVDAQSAIGLISVLAGTVLAWVLTFLASLYAKRRLGYSMRLHTYSGLAAYAASLEDRRCTEKSDISGGSSDTILCLQEPRELSQLAKKRPFMRLRQGSGIFGGQISLGQDPSVAGVKVKSGKIAIGIPSFDGIDWAAESESSSNTE